MLFFLGSAEKNPISHESYLVKVGEKNQEKKTSAGILNCCIFIKNALLSFARKTQDFLQGAQKLFVQKGIR